MIQSRNNIIASLNHKDPRPSSGENAIQRKWNLVAILVLLSSILILTTRAAEFADIEPLLQQHCVECHDAKEPEGSLVLDSFEGLMKGGEAGAAITPGKSAESILIKAMEGKWGKTGKNEFMPPGKKEKLKPDQIALFKAWIDAGAPAPKGPKAVTELNVPKVAPKITPPRAISALAYNAPAKLLAVARPSVVELMDPAERTLARTLTGSRGTINAVAFSPDGAFVFAAAGEPALFGEVRQWKVADGSLTRVFEGHKDAVYSLAVAPDGATLATGSYDYLIKLWNIADGKDRQTIAASQGAIFDLKYRADGKVLASASADRTAKLYNTATGERVDTLSQALKETYAVAFSPDGKRLVTGGGDNRIRVYEIGVEAKETTDSLLLSRFAHEGTILRLAFSADGKHLLSTADDKTAKLLDTTDFNERVAFEKQPDWPTGIAFLAEDKSVAIGRQDGSLQFYSTTDGKVVKPPTPELARVEPRGVQRGVPARLKLMGNRLAGVTEIKAHSDKLKVALEPASTNGEVWISLTAVADTARGGYEISVVSTNGESGRVKVQVDDLPQVNWTDRAKNPLTLTNQPVSVWSTLEKPGQTDEIAFHADAGQTLIFDLAGKSLGAKGGLVLTLLDANGKPLMSNDSFSGADDPLVAHTFASAGDYRLRVNDAMLGGSADHFYRVTIGALPFIAGIFPMSVATNSETEVQLIGYNLPAGGKTKIKAGEAGEAGLMGEPAAYRARREMKVVVSEFASPLEMEPNDSPDKATRIPLPASVNGRIQGSGTDVDYFVFEAKQGQHLMVETMAARRGSPVDTKVEVLWPNGKPVERLQLRAVRNSAVTFRPEDANDGGIRFESWEEMELNDYLYANGEVMKIFRMPQGPDSDTMLYFLNNRRRAYFDTTAIGHPLDEPCYIVEPQPPGTKSAPNGLPVFHVNYENDDDCERALGSDSRIHFTVPKDGSYLARVTDARGFSGERFVYRLVVREAEPDFTVALEGASPNVPPGSGQSFTVRAQRMDGFDNDINVVLERLPKGWTASTPLIIQAGHHTAQGTLFAAPDATQPTEAEWNSVGVVALASIEGRAAVRAVNNLGQPKLAKEKAKLMARIEAIKGEAGATDTQTIFIAPGQTVRAKVTATRNGFEEAVRFEVENLPHGVIVDNIGLNGITFLKGESEREIYLTASKWVGDLDRLIYTVETATGRQSSLPVMLKVRRPSMTKTASVK